jgi:hypothetical protein
MNICLFENFLGAFLPFCGTKWIHYNFMKVWKDVTSIKSLKDIAYCMIVRKNVYFFRILTNKAGTFS